MFSQTFANGNSKNEITNKTYKQRKKERRTAGREKNVFDGLTVAWFRPSVPPGSLLQKQWTNCLANVTYSYNPSTSPGG